jgi:hypothetical protein
MSFNVIASFTPVSSQVIPSLEMLESNVYKPYYTLVMNHVTTLYTTDVEELLAGSHREVC